MSSAFLFRMSWKFVFDIWSCFHKGLEWFRDGMLSPSHCLHCPHLRRLGLGNGDGAETDHVVVVSTLRVAPAEVIHMIDDLCEELLQLVDIPHPRGVELEANCFFTVGLWSFFNHGILLCNVTALGLAEGTRVAVLGSGVATGGLPCRV